MITAQELDGKIFQFDDKLLGFVSNPIPELCIGNMVTQKDGRYLCTAIEITKEGLHWSTFFLGTSIKGIIPYEVLTTAK